MLVNLIEISPEAYPLLVNHLLHHPLVHSPDQEIVYRDLRRRTSEGSGNALGFRAVAGARHRRLRGAPGNPRRALRRCPPA
jgi:hypothetical protein